MLSAQRNPQATPGQRNENMSGRRLKGRGHRQARHRIQRIGQRLKEITEQEKRT